MNGLKGLILPELLRYAVSRKMFCECGTILDVKTSVMAEWDDTPKIISCGKCFDSAAEKLAIKLETEPTASVDHMQVLDGREGAKEYIPMKEYLKTLKNQPDPNQLTLL